MMKRMAIVKAVSGPGDPPAKAKPRYADASKGATYQQNVTVHNRSGATRSATVTVKRGEKVPNKGNIREEELKSKYKEVKK